MSERSKRILQGVKRLNKIQIVFLIFLFSAAFSACGPSIRDHTISAPISFGAGWYHEGKSQEEMLRDYDGCQALSRQKDNDPFVTSDCMKQKGYILK